MCCSASYDIIATSQIIAVKSYKYKHMHVLASVVTIGVGDDGTSFHIYALRSYQGEQSSKC